MMSYVELNVIICRDEDGLNFYEGTPEHYGFDVAVQYVAFIYAGVHVVAWKSHDVEIHEYKYISRYLLALAHRKSLDLLNT